MVLSTTCDILNTWRPEQNVQHFRSNFHVDFLTILLKFVPMGLFHNKTVLIKLSM